MTSEQTIIQRKPFIIDRKKMIYGMLIFLAMLCIQRAYAVYNLKSELLDTKTMLLIASFGGEETSGELKKYLVQPPFCGWKKENADKSVEASDNFEATSKTGKVVKKTVVSKDKTYDFYICVLGNKENRTSLKAQILLVLMFAGLVALLTKYDNLFVLEKDGQQTKDNLQNKTSLKDEKNDKEIPNS